MKTIIAELNGAVKTVAFAYVVGEVCALVEYFLDILLKPTALYSWSYYLGPQEFVYGLRGPWQLIFHKLFAFGWLTPVAAAAVAVLASPLCRLNKRLNLRAPLIGVSIVTALIIVIESLAYFPVAWTSKGTQGFLALAMIPPAVVVILTTCFYLLFCVKPVAHVISWRPLRFITVAALGATALLSFLPPPESRPSHTGPNVFLITVDALRADKVGPYRRGGRSLTPHVDRFAATATTFRRAVAAGTWTLPSLASLHTGISARAHGAGTSGPIDTPARQVRMHSTASSYLGPSFDTLAELLYRNGYDTAAVVGNGFCEPRFGLAQGFRYYRSMEMFPGGVETRLYYTKLWYPFLTKKYLYVETTPTIERRVRGYLRRRQGQERPFFLWVHFLDCHTPYTPPQKYMPPDGYRVWDNINTVTPTAGDKKDAEALYDGEVRYIDDVVGRFLEELRGAGQSENTIIIISADHGEELWEHGGSEHGRTLYNEVATVPLIIKLPGAWAEGGFFNQTVSLIDLYATISVNCQAPSYKPNQSQDLSHMEYGPGHGPAYATGAHYGDPSGTAMFTADEKKWLFLRKDTSCLAYDLATDPAEIYPVEISPSSIRDVATAYVNWERECNILRAFYQPPPKDDLMLSKELKAMGYIK